MGASTFKELVADILIPIIDAAVPFLFGVTLAIIFWRIADAWIFSGGDPEKIEQGKKTALIAIIVLTVMVTVWGLVEILEESLFR